METQSCEAVPSQPGVRAILRFGTESYSVDANKGSLSEKILSLKEESMVIFKDFITRHNVPHEVPDEVGEASSDDEDEFFEEQQEKSKKKN